MTPTHLMGAGRKVLNMNQDASYYIMKKTRGKLIFILKGYKDKRGTRGGRVHNENYL